MTDTSAETSPPTTADLKGWVWVTRKGVHVDRIACSWLIRRFIDPNAVIRFVPGKGFEPNAGELRFDMFEGEITHEGDRCTFEVLLTLAGLADPALQAVAEIVHDIDLKDGKFRREETTGIASLIAGVCAANADKIETIDAAQIKRDATPDHDISFGEAMRVWARVAALSFGGPDDNARHYSGTLFFVPSDTLIADEALELGVSAASKLFGGAVPHPFVKTKAITHELVTEGADRPEGWSAAFGRRTRDSVLPGFTAFSAYDARLAAERLLPRGAVRLKEPLRDGGSGQTAITTLRALDEFLERYPNEVMATHGLVLETNLQRAVTLSVGQIAVGDLLISYHGMQRTVINTTRGDPFTEGPTSSVRVAAGVLDRLSVREEVHIAIAQARLYDWASAYPGFLASRRNYDVGQGIDGEGQWRSGVFEASWRSGGPSTAELAALTEFARDTALEFVEASAVKEFGRAREAPRGSLIHFQGDGPEDGPILRYTTIRRALRQAA